MKTSKAAGISILVIATLVASYASTSSATVSTPRAGETLPKQCPSHSVVAQTLGLTLRKSIVTYTSATYQSGGAGAARAMPAGPSPVQATQRTCLYTYPNAQQAAAEGIIVPVTITFEFPVTKANFTASKQAAQHSVTPVTVHGIGDLAWVIKAPVGDPRGGNSLFVLSGTTEVVVGAPPKATVALMTALVHRIL